MAVITISRQYFSGGDEIAQMVAEKLGYKLYDRNAVYKKIIELGCPEEKIKNYDEVRPGIFSALSKYNDEYLYYLKTAILTIAEEGNCVIEGRGACFILEGIENHVSVRVFEDAEDRIRKLAEKDGISLQTAARKIIRSDKKQYNFIKYYFDADIRQAREQNLLLNTSISDVTSCAQAIIGFTKAVATSEREHKGDEVLGELLLGQKIINMLRFVYFIDIDSMKAEVEDKKITLQGIASTKGIVDNAIKILNCEFSDYDVVSKIRIVQGGMGER
ncbi:MAG: cytidylate kinase-like family protein [Treponema sp.]|nr:cytidylate kinase-like family protein [Candidatus Treponema equifaecale]